MYIPAFIYNEVPVPTAMAKLRSEGTYTKENEFCEIFIDMIKYNAKNYLPLCSHFLALLLVAEALAMILQE